MNWKLFKIEQKAIKITKTYDGVARPTEYRIDSPDKIEEIIKHINTHPATYTHTTMKRDNLDNVPTVKVKTINEFLPSDKSITIVANVHYDYIKQAQEPTSSWVANSIKIAAGFLVLFLLFCGFTAMVMEQQHERNMVDQTCFMYLQHGVPQSIEIENTRYNLNPDGTLDDIDKVFLNPHHRELLAYQKCVKVNY